MNTINVNLHFSEDTHYNPISDYHKAQTIVRQLRDERDSLMDSLLCEIVKACPKAKTEGLTAAEIEELSGGLISKYEVHHLVWHSPQTRALYDIDYYDKDVKVLFCQCDAYGNPIPNGRKKVDSYFINAYTFKPRR